MPPPSCFLQARPPKPRRHCSPADRCTRCAPGSFGRTSLRMSPKYHPAGAVPRWKPRCAKARDWCQTSGSGWRGKPGRGGQAEAGGGSGDQRARDLWCGLHLCAPAKSQPPTGMPAEHLVTDARRRVYGWSHARARSWMTAASRSGCSEVVRWPPGNIRMSRPAAPSRARAAAIWRGS